MERPIEQLEFPSLGFPFRTVLNVAEVAAKLRISEQHVIDLIEEGKLRAVNIAGQGDGARRYYRIPVESYDHFVRENTL